MGTVLGMGPQRSVGADNFPADGLYVSRQNAKVVSQPDILSYFCADNFYFNFDDIFRCELYTWRKTQLCRVRKNTNNATLLVHLTYILKFNMIKKSDEKIWFNKIVFTDLCELLR